MLSIPHTIILSILEGFTEFLPISSTGHLVLANYFLGNDLSSSFIQLFEVAVQLGAVLAVVVYYFRDLFKWEMIRLLLAGVLPTIVIGFILKDVVSQFLGIPTLIASMLIVGGVIIIMVELWYRRQEIKPKEVRVSSAMVFGAFQSLALVPGVSRSASIIISGLLMRYPRDVITKFAFLLAVPTMAAATGYSLLKNRELFISGTHTDQLLSLSIGFVVTFITALIVVRYCIPFIRRYSFIPFGVYRIVVGIIILLLIAQ